MEHLALSLNNDHSPRKKLIDEILYPLIKTDINGYPINVMVDSGSASSHMISKVVEDNNIQTFQRDIPLQILGFGNKKIRSNYALWSNETGRKKRTRN